MPATHQGGMKLCNIAGWVPHQRSKAEDKDVGIGGMTRQYLAAIGLTVLIRQELDQPIVVGEPDA
mgnify:CR=1 FL=1